MAFNLFGKKQSGLPSNVKGEMTCSACEKKIKHGEFVAMIGKNTFLPGISFISTNTAYGWMIGAKRYCKGCLKKQINKM